MVVVLAGGGRSLIVRRSEDTAAEPGPLVRQADLLGPVGDHPAAQQRRGDDVDRTEQLPGGEEGTRRDQSTAATGEPADQRP